jgi:maltose O-acetyltransferase
MKTEKEKMLAGELYNAFDPLLLQERHRARQLTGALNSSGAEEVGKRAEIRLKLLGSAGQSVWIEPPFDCDLL